MKKYEFTGETKILLDGAVLHQIRALVKIVLGWTTVEIGSVGGWIEKEENLSHDGNAWVGGDAWVYGNAVVCGDARVYGNAVVCGDARVYGNARVYKMTHYLTLGPMGSRNAFVTFFRTNDKNVKVRCGCFYGTTDEFLAKVKQTHGDSKHAKTYEAATQLALMQIDMDD